MIKKTGLNVAKCLLLSLGTISVFSSLFLITVGATVRGWAQCGADSYIECSGGTRCVTRDQVGCTCYDNNNRIVDSHSCREASDGGEIQPVVNAY